MVASILAGNRTAIWQYVIIINIGYLEHQMGIIARGNASFGTAALPKPSGHKMYFLNVEKCAKSCLQTTEFTVRIKSNKTARFIAYSNKLLYKKICGTEHSIIA